MREEEIPDYNIFMMCERLNTEALTGLSSDCFIRNCRPDELEQWKAFPFDSDTVPAEHEAYMKRFVEDTYGRDMDLFFKNTLFVCNRDGTPAATCSHWKAYGKFTSIHWLKTLRSYEGKGLGRAVLSRVMSQFSGSDYPVYLHTHPGCFRAIKLYSDFGFSLLKGGPLGTRSNDLELCLPYLAEFMPREHFERLKIRETPEYLVKMLEHETTVQF